MRNNGLWLLTLIATAGTVALSAKPTRPSLKKVTEFDLPGPPGKRFDYLTITPTTTIFSQRTSLQARCTSSICALTKSWPR